LVVSAQYLVGFSWFLVSEHDAISFPELNFSYLRERPATAVVAYTLWIFDQRDRNARPPP
jgi:hypothetical protein